MRHITGPLAMLFISLILIIIGVILTITIVFSLIGIPLIIVGGIMLVLSIIFILFGTAGTILSFFTPKKKVVELKKKGDRYE